MTQLSNLNINDVAVLKPGYKLGAADVALLQDMARRLLAAEAQEPVATLDVQSGRPDGNKFALVYSSAAHKLPDDVYNLHVAPQPVAVPDDDKTNMLCDSAYVNGLQAGFSMGQMNQEEEYAQTVELYRKGIREYRAACRAAMLSAEAVSQPYTLPEDTKRLDWLDAQNKRLNEFYGTSYGWKFDANFQRNAMMLNDNNYPVMNVRQAIDEAMRAASQEPTK